MYIITVSECVALVLLSSHLFHHHVQRIAVLHVQLLRRLVLSHSFPVEQESNRARLERFALQERVEDLHTRKKASALVKYITFFGYKIILGAKISKATCLFFFFCPRREKEREKNEETQREEKRVTLF